MSVNKSLYTFILFTGTVEQHDIEKQWHCNIFGDKIYQQKSALQQQIHCNSIYNEQIKQAKHCDF